MPRSSQVAESVFGRVFFPTRQEGVVRLYNGIRVCDASTPRPHPVSCQIPPSIRKSCSPVDPAEYPACGSPLHPAEYPARAAGQWSRVSRQSCSPVDPAEYPARAARQWIPPSILPERLASASRRVSHQSSPPVDPAEHPTEYPPEYLDSGTRRRAARQWIPPSIPPEQPASGSRRVSC